MIIKKKQTEPSVMYGTLISFESLTKNSNDSYIYNTSTVVKFKVIKVLVSFG